MLRVNVFVANHNRVARSIGNLGKAAATLERRIIWVGRGHPVPNVKHAIYGRRIALPIIARTYSRIASTSRVIAGRASRGRSAVHIVVDNLCLGRRPTRWAEIVRNSCFATFRQLRVEGWTLPPFVVQGWLLYKWQNRDQPRIAGIAARVW